MNTCNDIFAAFGGARNFDRALGLIPGRGQVMKNRGSIPGRYWISVVDAAQARGIAISLETMARIFSVKRLTGDFVVPPDGKVSFNGEAVH